MDFQEADICYSIHLDYRVLGTIKVLTMKPASLREIQNRQRIDFSVNFDSADRTCLGGGDIQEALAELHDYGAVNKDNSLTLTGLSMKTAVLKHLSIPEENRKRT